MNISFSNEKIAAQVGFKLTLLTRQMPYIPTELYTKVVCLNIIMYINYSIGCVYNLYKYGIVMQRHWESYLDQELLCAFRSFHHRCEACS